MTKSLIKKKKTILCRYFSLLIFALILLYPTNIFCEFLNWKEGENRFIKSDKKWSKKENEKKSYFFKKDKKFFAYNDKWFDKDTKWHKKDASWIERDRKPFLE